MEPLALTRASELIHATDALERLGGSPEHVLGQAKLPMWHYRDPDDLIPKHHIFEFMDQAARSLGSPTFGLQVGAQTSLSSMGSVGRLIASSLTTYHAVSTSCRLIHLHNAGSRLSLVEAGDEVWFCHRESHSPKTGRWHKELFTLMRGIDNVRMGAGPSWWPTKVRLQTHEAPPRELREALGDPEIRIGQRTTAFAVPRRLLALPLQRRGTPVRNSQEEEARLRQTAPAPGFVETLRQLAGTLLKEERPPRIEIMAEITSLSVRTLQRRLAENRLSHSELIDQARYQAATRLLADSDIRMTDIAMELNYTDSANFTRAFKRWAGVTPREYRSQLQMG